MKFYTDFYKKGLSPDSTLQNDGTANRRLFIAGTASAYLGGQFDLASIRNENPNIDMGVMVIPHPDGRRLACSAAGLRHPQGRQNPARCQEVPAVHEHCRKPGLLHRHLPGAPQGAQVAALPGSGAREFKEMLPYGRPVPARQNWVQIVQAYFDGIQRILLGDQTAQGRWTRPMRKSRPCWIAEIPPDPRGPPPRGSPCSCLDCDALPRRSATVSNDR